VENGGARFGKKSGQAYQSEINKACQVCENETNQDASWCKNNRGSKREKGTEP
jgi:hypothetical protein